MTTFEDSLISFSHDIYKEIDGTVNGCVSPYSIISALLMLMAGTRGSSKTQIKSAILNNDLNDQLIYSQYQKLTKDVFSAKDNKLYIATKLYVKKGLIVTKNVRQVAQTVFDAGISNLDFSKSTESADEINRYIAGRTNNKITDVIKSRWLNSLTVLVLVNALYFKGSWETQFDPKSTRKDDFYLTMTNKVKIDMMTMDHIVRNYNGKSFTAVVLPYKGKKYEMVFVLPKQIDGFNALKTTFSPSVARVIDAGLKSDFLRLKIPKFSFSSETNLIDILPLLGITDIFKLGIANFTNLIENNKDDMYVSQARHKVVIEVNEFGTEAAATTVIVVSRKSLPRVEFIANHPFLFYIRHAETGSILFIGHFNGS